MALSRDVVVQDNNDLAPEDEQFLEQVLHRLRERVSERRLDPFREFAAIDHRLGFTNGVTPMQFQRMVDLTLQITLTPAEAGVLVRRYLNHSTGHVNYRAFIADIDTVSQLHATMKAPVPYLTRTHAAHAQAAACFAEDDGDFSATQSTTDLTAAVNTAVHPMAMTQQARENETGADGSLSASAMDAFAAQAADLATLQARIRRLLALHGVRAADAFKDYDRHRQGFITTVQFMAGLKSLDSTLDERALRLLSKHYASLKSNGHSAENVHSYGRPAPAMTDGLAARVAWRAFVKDVDTSCSEVQRLTFSDTFRSKSSWRGSAISSTSSSCQAPHRLHDSFNHMMLLDSVQQQPSSENKVDENPQFVAAMRRARTLIAKQGLLIEAAFTQRDRLRSGTVTMSQCSQALTAAGLKLLPEEVAAIVAHYTMQDHSTYSRHEGPRFHYRPFLQAVQPKVQLPDLSGKNIERRLAATAQAQRKTAWSALGSVPGASAARYADVMAYICNRVAQERMRVSEHLRDFDRLHTGRIRNEQLRTGLAMAKLQLSPAQYQALEEHYAVPHHPGFVDYRQLTRDVEAVFTQHDLHQQPLAEAWPMKPLASVKVEENVKALTVTEQASARSFLQHTVDFVRAHRPDLTANFQDYDRHHRGWGELSGGCILG